MRHYLMRSGCDRTVLGLWEYLDGELAPAPARAISAHIAECERCHARVASARAFLRAVAGSDRGTRAPGTLRARAAALRTAPTPAARQRPNSAS